MLYMLPVNTSLLRACLPGLAGTYIPGVTYGERFADEC